jgi:hypothetical protein
LLKLDNLELQLNLLSICEIQKSKNFKEILLILKF